MTESVIFTLPEEVRPDHIEEHIVPLRPDGSIHLDGIKFRASSGQEPEVTPSTSVITVIAGQGGGSRIAYMLNDETTTIATDPSYSSNFGYAVAYNGSIWVVACDANFLYSSDGITWSSTSVPGGGSSLDVVWCDSLNLFVAGTTSTSGLIATSSNGSTWIQRTTPWDSSGSINGLSWSNNLGMVLALGKDDNIGYTIMKSTDGTSWTSETGSGGLAFSNQLYRAAWSSNLGLWVAVGPAGDGNGIYSSTNGTSWTPRLSGGVFTDVSWSSSAGIFVSTPNGGTNVRTSTDGITWTNHSSVGSNINGVTWSSILGLFIITDGNRLRTSPDGINWTDFGSIGFTGGRLLAI